MLEPKEEAGALTEEAEKLPIIPEPVEEEKIEPSENENPAVA